jgi:hypothetical protein
MAVLLCGLNGSRETLFKAVLLYGLYGSTLFKAVLLYGLYGSTLFTAVLLYGLYGSRPIFGDPGIVSDELGGSASGIVSMSVMLF